MSDSNQKNIRIKGKDNKVVGRDDNSITNNYSFKNSKLSSLFERLKENFENNDKISKISEDLRKYTDKKDTIGLKQKLSEADKVHLFDDFAWCKQEFYKKLVLYQNYEPAQEIFTFILAIVLEKNRNVIGPMIREGKSESIILSTISNQIVGPILKLIQEEGCYDIMGLSATEIEGMFHYLTGNCHIKWNL